MNISVLGDGAFGTAISQLLSQNGHKVTLWCHNKDVAECIKQTRTNNIFLKDIKLSESIHPTTSLEEALQNDLICIAIPVAFMRSVLNDIKDQNKEFIIFSKGIENKTLLLPSQILKEVIPNSKVSIISGPSFAVDIVNQQPTAVNLACENFKDYEVLKKIFENNFFQTYFSQDIIGIQLQAAIKNVFAIGVGILDGLGYGDNTKTWFLMRCIEESKILTGALGGDLNSVYTYAGIGDLMLTCLGSKSKNLSFGKLIGVNAEDKKLGPQIPEGLNTVVSVWQLALKHSISLPICSTIYDIIFNKLAPESLVKTLLD